jgi:hypothetical protein
LTKQNRPFLTYHNFKMLIHDDLKYLTSKIITFDKTKNRPYLTYYNFKMLIHDDLKYLTSKIITFDKTKSSIF